MAVEKPGNPHENGGTRYENVPAPYCRIPETATRLGRDDFRAMVEAKPRRFAGTRPAHHLRKPPSPP